MALILVLLAQPRLILALLAFCYTGWAWEKFPPLRWGSWPAEDFSATDSDFSLVFLYYGRGFFAVSLGAIAFAVGVANLLGVLFADEMLLQAAWEVTLVLLQILEDPLSA